jgi:hypothetical protein
MPSVVMALDRGLRRFGGAPTYALTDNERTISVDHVAGIPVRTPQIVSLSFCEPARRKRDVRQTPAASRTAAGFTHSG